MKYGQLPKPRPNRTFQDGIILLTQQPILRCSCCGAEYSANPGDYWNVPADKEIICGECNLPMDLVMVRTVYEPVEV